MLFVMFFYLANKGGRFAPSDGLSQRQAISANTGEAASRFPPLERSALVCTRATPARAGDRRRLAILRLGTCPRQVVWSE